MKDLVSIIILNWNGIADTKECLASLNNITYKNYEIIIVDNGSKDNSITELKKLQARNNKIKLLQNRKNLGFAGGNNVGYKAAKGSFILFLNNDTIVSKNFLTVLVNKINTSDKIGAVQPKILNYSEKNIIDSIGSYLINTGFLYHFGHNKKDNGKYNKESKIFTMKGACMLFKREVLEKVGIFDDKYFAYFEETDLCQRTWIAGYSIWYVPDSEICHKGGQTAKHLPSAFVNYHSYKNRIYTYLKNFDPSTIIRVVPLHIAMCEVATLIYLATFQLKLAWAIQKAIFWNMMQIFSLRKERSKIAKIRRFHDNEYLPQLIRSVNKNYYYHLFATSLVGYED